MAVSCHVAFGHYLRTLRERRGLALEDVWSLSQTFPESLNKGYLSRCENGKQKLALPKVVAISHIYEVPSDVLVERLELDLELEKIGGPSTENLTWAQLREAGKNAVQHGHRWAAYAFVRDATFKAADADLNDIYSNIEEQITSAFMNCATTAQALGKYRFALHEFEWTENSNALGPEALTLVADRLAIVHNELGNQSTSWKYADLALARLDDCRERIFEPYVFQLHGLLRLRQRDHAEAIPWFQKTYDSFRARDDIKGGANALIGLADCYQESGNPRAAARTLDVAKELCDKHDLPRCRALALTLMGLVDEDLGRTASAEANLRMATNLAKDLNDRILRFQVEFYLYKHAVANKKRAASRAVLRRLESLAVSVPESVEQLLDFRAMQKQLKQEETGL